MNGPSLSPVILCGGTGSRLWPFLGHFPKQYLSLFDESRNSLLQETQSRLKNLINIDSPIIYVMKTIDLLLLNK